MADDFIIKNEFGHNFLMKYIGHESTPIIPGEVEIIGRGAFENCDFITSIIIHQGVQEIREHAFSHCSNLEIVEMLGAMSIGDFAFYNCASLSRVMFPESLLRIGDAAFAGCESLTSLELTNIIVIGTSAFQGCVSLTNVQISSDIELLYEEVFSGCTDLSSVVIHGKVDQRLLRGIFQGCNKLKKVIINNEDGDLLELTINGSSFDTVVLSSNSDNKNGEMSSLETKIWDKQTGNFHIVDGCLICIREEQDEILIPEHVKRIGEKCFSNKQNIISVVIPEGVVEIGRSAFKGCTNLKSVNIPETVVKICSDAFKECTSLYSVLIPSSVREIGGSAFSHCQNLVDLLLSEGLETIGWYAFSNCSSLINLIIPGSVKKTESNTFSNCDKLSSVVMSEGIEVIGYGTFSGCNSLKNVQIPSSLKMIERSAFSECTSLSSITIPENVSTISDNAFRGCTSLTRLKIPGNVKSIMASAFSDCINLSSVQILDGVQTIGERAFENCKSLVDVQVSSSVIEMYKNSFSGTPYQDTQSGQFHIINNLLLDYFGDESDIVIPENVRIINKGAFENNPMLEYVTIHSNLERIDENAFAGCSSLASLEIPGSVKVIQSFAFSGCSNLSSLSLLDGIKVIEEKSFSNCSSLSSLKIPGSVRTIKDYAFFNCSGLTHLELKKGVNEIGHCVFEGCKRLENLIIHESLREIKASAFFSLGKREMSVIYQHTSPTITNFGKVKSNIINLLDENRIFIGRLYIPMEDIDGLYVNFMVRLMNGMVKHLSDYDALFSKSNNTVIQKVKLILTRLKNPLELNVEYKDEYRSYLKNFAHYHVPFLIRANDIATISDLADYDVISKQDIDSYIELALQYSQTEVQAFLMEYKNKTWGEELISRMIINDLANPNDWLTHEDSDERLTIKKYLGSNFHVTIPSRIEDKPIKCVDGWNIGDVKISLFSLHKDKVKSVVIEDGIEIIGERAFLECRKMKSLTLPDSVSEIGKEAFYGCDNLVIHAPEGSYAVEYAKEKDIKFIEI